MATVRERIIIALGRRVENWEAKAEAAGNEINWALNAGAKETDPDELFHYEVYINFLTDVQEETLRKLGAARKTLSKAREARVTGRLQ